MPKLEPKLVQVETEFKPFFKGIERVLEKFKSFWLTFYKILINS